MQSVRANLRAVATAMLLGQLGGFALLPAALCCASETAATKLRVSAGHDGAKRCCPGMSPGQVCPMHGADSQKQDGPRLRCAPDSDNPTALIGLIGVLSAPATIGVEFASAEAIDLRSFDALTIDIIPISPPPRA
jgi:hypothetical protein